MLLGSRVEVKANFRAGDASVSLASNLKTTPTGIQPTAYGPGEMEV